MDKPTCILTTRTSYPFRHSYNQHPTPSYQHYPSTSPRPYPGPNAAPCRCPRKSMHGGGGGGGGAVRRARPPDCAAAGRDGAVAQPTGAPSGRASPTSSTACGPSSPLHPPAPPTARRASARRRALRPLPRRTRTHIGAPLPFPLPHLTHYQLTSYVHRPSPPPFALDGPAANAHTPPTFNRKNAVLTPPAPNTPANLLRTTRLMSRPSDTPLAAFPPDSYTSPAPPHQNQAPSLLPLPSDLVSIRHAPKAN